MNQAHTIIYCVFPPILKWHVLDLKPRTCSVRLSTHFGLRRCLLTFLLTHRRIDSFRVLRQSFCGKFLFSADFSIQFFGCMARGEECWIPRHQQRGHNQSATPFKIFKSETFDIYLNVKTCQQVRY